jgi:flavin reductase (DIM6/NTAB) family NADH-FMN oxidoreductase RutF
MGKRCRRRSTLDPQLAQALKAIPYGIYALTTPRDDQLLSLIVSWVSQVSYSPPLLMVALRHNRRAVLALRPRGLFSLSLLTQEQKPLVASLKNLDPLLGFSEHFSERGQQEFPVLKECLVSWQCRVLSTAEAGDHVLFIGEVQSASAVRWGKPLITTDYGKTYIGES